MCPMGRPTGEWLTFLAKGTHGTASPSNGCCEPPWWQATGMQSWADSGSWRIAVSGLPLLSKCHRLNTLLPDLSSALIPESQPGEVQYPTAGKKINSNNTKRDSALFCAASLKRHAFHPSLASKMSVIFPWWNEWYLNTPFESRCLEGFSHRPNGKQNKQPWLHLAS